MNDKHLWHGRFSEAPSDSLMAYTASIGFDVRLWRDDLAGSVAHTQMLGASGVLPQTDSDAIVAALRQVEAEFAGGTFQLVESDEDIHTAIERRVTEIAGPLGRNSTRVAAETTRLPPRYGCLPSASLRPPPDAFFR